MRRPPLRAKSELFTLLPFGRARYREQALAIFRLTAALSFFALFPLIRNQAGDHSSAFCLVLLGYTFASLMILARVFLASTINRVFLASVHASDLIWPALICLFTGGGNSPFVFLFIFALLASPYRCKWLETLLIAFCSIFVMLSESFLLSIPALYRFHLLRSPIHIGSILVNAWILVVVAASLSYFAFWAEREQQAYAIRNVLRRLRSDVGIQGNMREVLPAILDVFEARRAVLVLKSASEGRVLRWAVNKGERDSNRSRMVSFGNKDQYFPLPQSLWSIACSRTGSPRNYLALNRYGSKIAINSALLHNARLLNEPFESLLVTKLEFGNEWTGQLFLVDAPCAAGRETCLQLLQQLGNELGPATYNFYLWRHTSTRVRAIERQRLARDLHDGVVQSLIATEVQLELLRRRSSRNGEHTLAQDTLPDVQNLLRMEVKKLRWQIEQLRSSTCIGPFLPRLNEMIESFRRETGIVTEFSCDVQEGSVPNRISTEVLHILEEALSNIRRHSGAEKVDVRLTSDENAWEILVQDDGCGFDFNGRLSLSQLEAAKKGPKVIRERVHSAKGDLVVESYRNRGTRLEIRLAANG